MKRILTLLAAIVLLSGCGSPSGWSDAQKEEVRAQMSDNREKFMLQYMSAEHFSTLQECVLEALIGIFPEYEEYNELNDRDETLDGMMCDCAVETMGANYENLKTVFPWETLRKAGILSTDNALVPETQFYKRLAGLIRALYPNPDAFVMALMLDPNAQNDLRQMMAQSASGQ